LGLCDWGHKGVGETVTSESEAMFQDIFNS
jgi:hypothetical protein